jgi:hypothetical protein
VYKCALHTGVTQIYVLTSNTNFKISETIHACMSIICILLDQYFFWNCRKGAVIVQESIVVYFTMESHEQLRPFVLFFYFNENYIQKCTILENTTSRRI